MSIESTTPYPRLRYAAAWGLIAVWIAAYFLSPALHHFVSGNRDWEFRTQLWIWFSLSGTATGLACWLTLGDGRWFVRLVLVLWAFVWSWMVWQLAAYVAFQAEERTAASSIMGFGNYAVGVALIAFTASASLLITARLVLGTRLQRDHALGPLATFPRRFSLSQFMVVIAILSVSVGVARIIVSKDLSWAAVFTFPDRVAGLFYSSFCNALIVIPVALTLVFLPQRIVWAILYFGIGCFVFTVFEAIPWMGWKATDRLTTYWIANTLTYAAMLTLFAAIPLMGLRLAGYELRLRAGEAEMSPSNLETGIRRERSGPTE
jgi:hypothetical protein